MPLETYNKKRDFKKTPEPPGKTPRGTSGHSFVIQKHAARRLHYDFRLELDGALLSWAVPKGPSLDPKEKRLAVHVEDHPVEYGKFEGIIPEKQYGAGAVILWDRGTWEPKGDARASYREGSLKFDLNGEKLRGGWALVRMKGREQNGRENWLLIKERDDEAEPGDGGGIVERETASVASGYTIEQMAADPKRRWSGGKARELKSAVSDGREKRLPEKLTPQLATLVKEVPGGEGWLHEIKHDGYRILCRVEDGDVLLLSRNGLDWTSRFPTIVEAAKKLPVQNGWLDGEVVVQRADGSTSFQDLQNALNEKSEARLVYFAFDVPFCNGRDLRGIPLVERKTLLKKLIPSKGAIRYSDHVEGKGAAFFAHACEHELEGIISKERGAKYVSARSRSWVKVKCGKRQEFVIGGYTDPSGSRVGLGALLVGLHDEGGALCYAGKVGTGFNSQSLRELTSQLSRIEQEKPAFANPPRERGVHWVRPELVAEIAFAQWTADDVIRHSSFQGLRADKSARKIVREAAADVKPAKAPQERLNSSSKVSASRHSTALRTGPPRTASRDFKLTNPDKVLYAEQGLTKRDLALYYDAIADLILPHLRNRPLTLVRCPNGPGQCFYQKHMKETVPEAIASVAIPEDDGTTSQYMMVNSREALIATVQMGVLELHPWGSTADKLERPDRMFFDLDPDAGLDFGKVIEAAKLLHDRLADLGLISFVKTTGGKGLHVVVPLERRHGWDEVKAFSRALAEDIVRQAPRFYVATMSKAKRKGKIFIDYLRNGRGQTAVAVFSTRAKPGATLSVPLDWKELKRGLRPDQWNVVNLGERLRKLRRDPWAEFFKVRQSLTQKMERDLARK